MERRDLEAAARWLALSRQPHVTPSLLARVFRRVGSSLALFTRPGEELSQLGLRPEQVADLEQQVEQLAAQLNTFQAQNIQPVPIESADYPAGLLDLRVPPMVIFVRGELKSEDRRAIAIVGTRTPSRAGLSKARELARRAVAAGFCVVSGLARGIDTAAHQSALLATGRTIAVVGNGLLKVYPPENKPLAGRISRRGAVISELWPEANVSRHALLARDRLQAAMAQAVIVVQTHTGCGSLTTARHAIACRRPLFALKWDEEPFASGVARLREIGAEVITEDDFDEVFRAAEAGRNPRLFA